jgi:hypothetical protein
MTKQEVITQLEELLQSGDATGMAEQLDALETEFRTASGEQEDPASDKDADDGRFQELVTQLRERAEQPTAEAEATEAEVTQDESLPVEEPQAEKIQEENLPEEEPVTVNASETDESPNDAPPVENGTAEKTDGEEAVPQSKQQIVAKLEELLKGNDLELIAAELETLETEFQKASDTREQEQRDAFTAENGEEGEFAPAKDTEDNRFKELVNSFNARREKYDKQQEQTQQDALKAKQEVIEDLKKLIKEEDRIEKAFDAFKALQEKWRTSGPVSPKLYKQLQSEYSHQIDMFFYTIDIYRALKIHDFKRNAEIKRGLIVNMQRLKDEQSISKMEALVKTYQNEWTETGPVPEEEWKDIRNEFWKATNEVYEKIQVHYDSMKEQYNKNLEAKRALVDKIKGLAASEPDSHNKWQALTEEILAIQKEWKTIGPAQKKDNDRIWREFRAVGDAFFAGKKAFYDSRKEELHGKRDQKLELIKKAEALKDSTEWRKTSEELIELQNQWKEAGSAGQKEDNKLWAKFRGACNHFFDAKKQYFAGQDDRYSANLTAKEELIKKVEAFEPTGDNGADMDALKAFSNEWREIGHVARKDSDRVYDIFKAALDDKYDALRSNKSSDRGNTNYKSRVEGFQQSGDSRGIDMERRNIKDQIKKLEDTIDKYETNMSFFGRSKGADVFKADIQKNIDKAKEEIAELQKKLKILQHSQQQPKPDAQ